MGGHVEFWDVDGVMNALMQSAEWEAPERFWRIFLAFEDSETHLDPQASAASRVAAELSGL
ncbi:hypothetical protein ACFFGH_34350 [Lysobacter korlensis]|uniref:Uncharacterized protein n=1 Tax=Lysobacter korlensis TaxID=553636 RepID=A0ABV6S143_9GAMM